MRWKGLLAMLTVSASLAVPAPAGAATAVLGELAPPGAGFTAICGIACTVVQDTEDPNRNTYRAPFDGVVTRWGTSSGGSGYTVRLRVWRATADPVVWTLMAESQDLVLGANASSFPSAAVPIKAGDHLGLRATPGGRLAYSSTGSETVRGLATGANETPGQSASLSVTFTPARVHVIAWVETDNDLDGAGDDTQDGDDDNDGVVDGSDNCTLASNPSQRNTDGAGAGDACDGDDDDDGVGDDGDNCPQAANTDQRDADAGGGGDVCDPDDENDGVADAVDNCPAAANLDQDDADLSGGGDACDADDDEDGLTDAQEAASRTERTDRDTDDDGLGDAAETTTSPLRADTDRDRLPDGLELGLRGGLADPPGLASATDMRLFRGDRDPKTKTNPRRADTDRDGLRDGAEDRNRNGRRDRGETDPRRRDSDRDGARDGRDRFPLNRGRR